MGANIINSDSTQSTTDFSITENTHIKVELEDPSLNDESQMPQEVSPSFSLESGNIFNSMDDNSLPSFDDKSSSLCQLSVPQGSLFAQVPGRLSLLSNVVKYRMSVGEVRRRLMGPESFNFSLLGALLRRAKMPEKSKMLVEELERVGLSIPRGRRRLSQISLLSALTESESIQLVSDFRKISQTEFPSTELAHFSSTKHLSTSSDTSGNMVSQRLKILETSINMAHEFLNLLANDRSPIVDKDPEPVFDQDLQDRLSMYSMLTHGFGNPAIQVGVEMFIAFLKAQICAVNKFQTSG